MSKREAQIKALASDQRLKILKLLSHPKRHFSDQWSADPVKFGVCMTLIAKALGVSQPTLSRHMELLRLAGFVTTKRHERWVYCQRDEGALSEYHRWLGRKLGV